MGNLFGFWEMNDGLVLLIYILLVILALGCVLVLWYKFRKAVWALIIVIVVSFFLTGLTPLIINQLFFMFTQNNITSIGEFWMYFLDGASAGLIALVCRQLIYWGFDIARWEPFGKQN